MFLVYNFFFILNLFCLLVLIFNYNQLSYKKYFINSTIKYFFINIIHAFVCSFIQKFRINDSNWIEFLFTTCGLFYVYYQYYYFQNIIFCITNKKAHFIQKRMLFITTSVSFIRLYIKIKNFLQNNTLASVSSLFSSKILFISMICIYTFFIIIYIIPTLILLYQTLKAYKTKSTYFFILQVLSIILISKFFLDITQSIFFDYLRFLLNNSYLSYIADHIQSDSDKIIIILSMYVSPIIHIQFLLFLKEHQKVIIKNYNYNNLSTLPQNQRNKSLSINIEEVKKIFTDHHSMEKLLMQVIISEVHTITQCPKENILILKKNNQSIYEKIRFEYFQDNSLFQYLAINKMILFDDLYDFCHAAQMVEIDPETLTQKKNLLSYCIAKKIKLILNLNNYNKKIDYLMLIILDNHTQYIPFSQFTMQKIITLSSLWLEGQKYNILANIKKKFEYINQIEQYNFLEQKTIYEAEYKRIKNNFCNIESIAYCQTAENTIKFSGASLHERCIQQIHKELIQHNNEKNLLHYIHNGTEYTIVSFLPRNLEKNIISIHTILPSTKISNDKLVPIIEQKNIELLFSIDNITIKNQLIDFYSRLKYTYNIKIIFNLNCNQPIIKKILYFILPQITIENIIFKKKFYTLNDLHLLFLNIQNANDKIFIIYGFYFLSIDLQNYFFYLYTQLCIDQENHNVKIYIIIEQDNKYSQISLEISSLSKIIRHPICYVADMAYNDIKMILYNFNIYLYKTNYNIQIIDENLEKIYASKKSMPLYQFINYFFKIIHCRLLSIIHKEDDTAFEYALHLGKKALKNHTLMRDIKRLCQHNNTQIAYLLGVDKSSIIRYFHRNK